MIPRRFGPDLFLRDLTGLSRRFGTAWFRVSVKEDATARKIVEILQAVLGTRPARTPV